MNIQKIENFQAGVWRERYQYKSFEPTKVNALWIWEEYNTPRKLDQKIIANKIE